MISAYLDKIFEEMLKTCLFVLKVVFLQSFIAHGFTSGKRHYGKACRSADVAKLVDVPDLGSGAARCVGSSPSIRTYYIKRFKNKGLG